MGVTSSHVVDLVVLKLSAPSLPPLMPHPATPLDLHVSLHPWPLDGGRRLFIGEEHGDVLLVNATNGVVLSRAALHTKEVTCVVYCGQTGFLISTGGDGKICMTHEVSKPPMPD